MKELRKRGSERHCKKGGTDRKEGRRKRAKQAARERGGMREKEGDALSRRRKPFEGK